MLACLQRDEHRPHPTQQPHANPKVTPQPSAHPITQMCSHHWQGRAAHGLLTEHPQHQTAALQSCTQVRPPCRGALRGCRGSRGTRRAAPAALPARSAPVRNPRVLPAALHQAQQPALHAVPRRQEALNSLGCESRNAATAAGSGGDSGREQRKQTGGNGDSAEGTGTARRRRGQRGAGSAAAPRQRGPSKDTIRQVAPSARLSWMATDWSMSVPGRRPAALPAAAALSGPLAQGDQRGSAIAPLRK